MLENPGQVSERLLVSQNVHVSRRRVLDQFTQFLGLQRSIGRSNQRMFLERVLIFHVVGEQVHLQFGAQIDMLPQCVQRRTGTARQVVLKTAPPQRRPVADLQTRQPVLDSIGTNQLAERLHSMKEPRRIDSTTADVRRSHFQEVTLSWRILWKRDLTRCG